MHVSELLEQIKDSRDVVCIRCSQVVVSLANQFFTLIPDKLTETIGNFDVPSVAVCDRNVLRLHCNGNTPSPGGIRSLGFVSNNARWSIGLSFWHVDTSVYTLRYKRCAFVPHCEKAWLGNQARLPLSHVEWISTPARLVVHLFHTSMSML